MPRPTKNTTDHLHPAKKAGRVRMTVVLVVVAILVASATAATQIYMSYRLPDPETADLDGLFRWLVTVDLADYPPEVQHTLIRRLEEEIDTTIDWTEIDRQLTDEYRCQLWNNVEILLRSWFFERMDRYYAGTAAEKIEVVDQILDQSEIWRGIASLAPPGKIKTEKSGFGMAMFLMSQIEEWKKSSSPEEVKRLNDFVTVIEARWLIRKCLGKA